MKHKQVLLILTGVILILSTISCVVGLFYPGDAGQTEYLSVGGEIIKLYGSGLYRNDSIAYVAQGKASDGITLVCAIPLLLYALVSTIKGSFRARLVLTGTLGYFLYTYMSYTFLWMYNPFFIIYVILMSASLFALILAILSFDIAGLPSRFSEKLPTSFLGGFQLFIAFAIGMLWLGKIATSLIQNVPPLGLDHYTTLVIQGMDLGFVVPIAVLSGMMIIKRKPFGYLLTSIVIIKGITMLTCISAMIVNSILSGIDVSIVEIVLFFGLNILSVISLVLLLSNIKKTEVVTYEI